MIFGRKKIKEAKQIIKDLLYIIDHIHDEFTTVRQHDIRYKNAKDFIKEE